MLPPKEEPRDSRSARLEAKLRRELGPILELLEQPDVTDVIVNGEGAIWVEDGPRGMVRLPQAIHPLQVENILSTVACLLDLVITPENPEVGEFDRKAEDATNLAAHSRVGLLKSVAVKRGSRRRGVGTQLSKEAIEILKNEFNCTAVAALAWESGSAESAPGVLEGLGFECKIRIEEYWRSDSEARGYRCSKCGPPPCLCAAGFYFRSL